MGQYDQLAPLYRLRGKKELYSFDLTAATDFLVTSGMLVGLFGEALGGSWAELLANTPFRSPERLSSPRKGKVYYFTRGQPLGFY